jgi:hypothetical protein
MGKILPQGDWKMMILKRAERWLGKPKSPLVVKEMAWRLINWVVSCGVSNPVSFVLRPLVMSSGLRTAVGINLVILVVGLGIWGPLPTMAENTGGQLTMVTGETEISLSTPVGVQIPIKSYVISQGFWAFHAGIDMASDVGEPIRPIMSGVVSKVEKNWFGYGNMVIVKHSSEYESLYAHMSKILVTEGQEVGSDSILGLVGNTGRSTGPHLHLEIHEHGQPINPANILGIKAN